MCVLAIGCVDGPLGVWMGHWVCGWVMEAGVRNEMQPTVSKRGSSSGCSGVMFIKCKYTPIWSQ